MPEPFREVLPKRGLLFTESQPQTVLCKPKLLPLKSLTLERLETMQREAKDKAREQMRQEEEEAERHKREFQADSQMMTTEEEQPSHHQVQSESVSFE